MAIYKVLLFNTDSGFAEESSVYYNNANGYVGILNNNPTAPLHVVGVAGVSANIQGDTYAAGTLSSQFLLRKANGTVLAPTAILSGDRLGLFGCAGYDGSVFSGFTGVMTVTADADWNTGSYPSNITFSTTAINATVRSERMRIDNAGLVAIGTQTTSARLTIAGSLSQAIGTVGNILRLAAITVTDNITATGSIATVYGSRFNVTTFDSANAISITSALVNVRIDAPALVAGNLTLAANVPSYALSLGGTLQLAGSTATRAAFNLPSATSPSTILVSGDFWVNGNVLKQYNGTTTRRYAEFTDATPANGQLLIGNGSTFALATITAGSTSTGITITNGAGTIAVSINQGFTPTWTGAHVFNNAVTLMAGTTTIAPLTFPTGTLKTSPTAGTMEYDGTNFYLSPSTTRKRIPLFTNATPANGQLLIGNGADFTLATLTQSTGIKITNTSGAITLETEDLQSLAGDPTTANIAASKYRVYKNTTSGVVKLWVNDGGTLKSVALT